MNKKKITINTPRNIKLIGDFYKSNSKKVIIMVHGFTGVDMKMEILIKLQNYFLNQIMMF